MSAIVTTVFVADKVLNPSMPGYQPPEPPPPPVVMPTPDDQAVKDAQKRATAIQRRRRGRASTILTATGDVGSGTLGAS